jgi:altronate hydrolase
MTMSVSTQDVVKLEATDPVGLACADLTPGAVLSVEGVSLRVRDVVPRGHKVALTDLPAGAEVRKYGQPIGLAMRDIAAGEHVHDHNLRSLSRAGATQLIDQSAASRAERVTAASAPAAAAAAAGRSFEGIVRADGRVGTRNYVGILSSVNCSATVVKRIAAAFSAPGALDEHSGVDGVIAITHGTGCGMAADGEGLALLRRTLAGYARHPNIGAVVLVGLGCEVNQISALTEDLGLIEPLVIQDLGGSMATVRAGVDQIRELLPDVAAAGKRVSVPASKLTLGLNCGGSDAWSGVTANPVLGIAADRLVAAGGTAVLAETPEIQGATHLLTRRAASPDVTRALLERVQWWEQYAAAEGGNLDNNPSPGNRAGGITTIEEKALGAVAKGGSSPLRAVYRYAEQINDPGLVFMDTPGYDPVSVTGIVAGGANVVCFTTGRGSVFGCRPAPSLKLATTTALYERMSDDMDFDCGPVIDGEASVAELGEALFEEILEVASGRHTKSEELGFGDEEFVPWQLGAVL